MDSFLDLTPHDIFVFCSAAVMLAMFICIGLYRLKLKSGGMGQESQTPDSGATESETLKLKPLTWKELGDLGQYLKALKRAHNGNGNLSFFGAPTAIGPGNGTCWARLIRLHANYVEAEVNPLGNFDIPREGERSPITLRISHEDEVYLYCFWEQGGDLGKIAKEFSLAITA